MNDFQGAPRLPTLRDWADLPDWVAWTYDPNKPDRPTKPPRVTLGGPPVDVRDPKARFLTLGAAEALLTQLREASPLARERGAGVGIVLNRGSGTVRVIGIDLDNCRDPATGEIAPWALEIVRRFDSYTEISPSGTGVKIFLEVRGEVARELRYRKWVQPGPRDPNAVHETAIEFHVGGFFTVTWRTLELPPAPLPDPARHWTNTWLPREPESLRQAKEQDLDWLIGTAGPALEGRPPEDAPSPQPRPSPRKTRRGPIDLEELRDALGHVSADDYDRWIEVGLALHHDLGDDGFEIWAEWSRPSSNFGKDGDGEAELRKKWGTFRRTREGRDRPIGVASIFYWAREAGWDRPARAAPRFSDEDLALSFAAAHADDLRYTDKWGQWHVWVGTHWRPDDTLAALDLSREHCRAEAGRADRLQSRIASARTVAAVLSLARADRRLAASPEDWDRDPLLLATPGGTVDLRTGLTRPAAPADFITQCTAVAPGGACERWLAALASIFPNAPERIDFLQVWLGYCLTGLTREEQFLYLHGDGRNGKDTLLDTIVGVMGTYATAMAASTLMAQKHEQHPAEIAKLRGARLALASEVEKGARWNVGRLKLLTGGGTLTAHFMRENWFDFRQTHKLVVEGNERPRLGNVDTAIADRVIMLEFGERFTKYDSRTDRQLKEKLRAEGGGILAWMIVGARLYLQRGLTIPESIRADTARYLAERDDFRMWLDECCVLEDDPARRGVTTRELMASYVAWRQRNPGVVWLDARGLVKRLRGLAGVGVEDRQRHGLTYVHGVRLVSPLEEQDAAEATASQGGLDLGADDDPL
jgi:putative DNA primase/helicase